MNIAIDVVIGLIIVLTVITGIKRGIVKVTFGFTGFIVALIVAWLFASQIGERFFSFLPSAVKYMAGFFLVFSLLLIAFLIFSWLLSKLLDIILLGWLNRLLGGIAGFLVGLGLSIFLIWSLLKLYPQIEQQYSKTYTVPLIVKLTRVITGDRIFPRELLKEKNTKIKI